MNLIEMAQLLGNFGEFAGAIAVIATLAYVAVQVRHGKIATEANTRAIEESRRLALAQTYQARANSVNSAIGSIDPVILSKLTDGRPGWHNINPENIDELSQVEKEELFGWLWRVVTHIDSVEFQRTLGLVTDFLNRDDGSVRALYPVCLKLDMPIRPSFARLVDELGL